MCVERRADSGEVAGPHQTSPPSHHCQEWSGPVMAAPTAWTAALADGAGLPSLCRQTTGFALCLLQVAELPLAITARTRNCWI